MMKIGRKMMVRMLGVKVGTSKGNAFRLKIASVIPLDYCFNIGRKLAASIPVPSIHMATPSIV